MENHWDEDSRLSFFSAGGGRGRLFFRFGIDLGWPDVRYWKCPGYGGFLTNRSYLLTHLSLPDKDAIYD